MLKVSVGNYVVTHQGQPPFVAKSASDKTLDWPFWYVHGADYVNFMMTDPPRFYGGKFLPRQEAEAVAVALNECV